MPYQLVWLLLIILGSAGTLHACHATEKPVTESASSQFPVIELRRHTINEGARRDFATYFETWFPDAFRQLGAIVFGQFLEREDDTRFTWLRGFQGMDARARINAELYYGPLWKERKAVMNRLIVDSDDVLLLRPLDDGDGIPMLPPVDPVHGLAAAPGIMVMQIFRVERSALAAFADHARKVLESYQTEGVRNAGLLVTLDAANNFPQLPVREDGPYLVWLGIVEDEETLDSVLLPLVERAMTGWRDSGMLAGAPEWVVMDPTSRSRLRWLAR